MEVILDNYVVFLFRNLDYCIFDVRIMRVCVFVCVCARACVCVRAMD
jgi:hypothetical protein